MFFYPRKSSNVQHLVAQRAGTHKILWLSAKLASLAGIAICLGNLWLSSGAQGSVCQTAGRSVFRRRRLLFTDDAGADHLDQPRQLGHPARVRKLSLRNSSTYDCTDGLLDRRVPSPSRRQSRSGYRWCVDFPHLGRSSHRSGRSFGLRQGRSPIDGA